ncbi:ABH_G0025410.mRNA.1.CDS.1 [Saccharomyces cerevisiae]|nr:ABH_G0025410.mRNA.1.CDS.1 [Saccharomyces cerevisiae]CAI4510817.1 CFS_G0024050.mRNA.1.CDS.1 [Saccharomyces cerevisiae]CAI6683007.1 ABH_G0025410.mRNA.1.CDS.1 [Saccharomyces cerevisiae]CAI7331917.1 CFS_G0024050.mRNA.1.CDS.1 [Saccharomyces cerevisiae]
MFSELINFQNEGHECQCQCGSCKNNEQCQNHVAAQRGVTATTNAPAVTSLKKPRSHAALGNKTNSL